MSFIKTTPGAERHGRWACHLLLFMLLLWDTDMTSTPCNYCDWLMRLFAGRMFGKIDLDPKNKRFTSSPRNICVLCGFTNNTNSSLKKHIFVRINWKKLPPLCNGLKSVGRLSISSNFLCYLFCFLVKVWVLEFCFFRKDTSPNMMYEANLED